jgi:signal transduction histidine kinase
MSDEYLGSVSVLRDITAEVKADLAKNEFISTVSHELRTPLTPVLASLENILTGMYGTLNPTQRDRLGIALISAREEVRLIDNLLDLVRIQENRTVLERKESVTRSLRYCQSFRIDTQKSR